MSKIFSSTEPQSLLRRRQLSPPLHMLSINNSATQVPRSPATPPPPPPASSTPPPSPTACVCTSQIASAQASASQNIASISAAAASSVSSAQAAQVSLQQSVHAANSALKSLQTSYSSALSSVSVSLSVASSNVASATSHANSAIAAQASAQQTASAALASVQNSASVALSIAASSASSVIASATSLAGVAQSSASLAINSANASVKTKATATFEVGGDSIASPTRPAYTAVPICDIASTTTFRVISAVLAIILLFVLSILFCLFVTRYREHRKSRNLYNTEGLHEVREAREMKPHDVDLLYRKQDIESRKGSRMSHYRQERTPTSPISSPMNLPPLFSSGIKRSRTFSSSPTNQFPLYNTLGISRQPSQRRPSSPIHISTPFQPDPRRSPSSPTVSTNVLSTRSNSQKAPRPTLQVMIPNGGSSSIYPSQDISPSQFTRPKGRSLTHPNQMQSILGSFPPATTEPPHPAFASESSTPSFGFQTIPPPLSPKSKSPVFPTHGNLKANSIPPANQLKPSKSSSSLRSRKVTSDNPQELKQRSNSVPDKTVSALVSEIDALSREQERRRRIEGWLDAPEWGEGSVRSVGRGRQRQHSVTIVATQEGNGGFHIGEAF